ncbi:hypothetical protein ACLOJK_005571 [Asimina triloba]
MERRTCKLCSKTFSNGRALGGHMRSHMTILSPNPTPKPQQLPPTPSLSSSSEEEEGGGGNEAEEAKGLSYGLRENPQRSFRLADPEFSFAVDAASSVVQDRESETESSKHPSRKRSNRLRRQQSEQKPELEPEPLSSVSDTTTEEDVARCLMMLSRDIWMRGGSKPSPESDEEEPDVGYDDEDEEEEEEEDESGHELKLLPRSRSKFQCGTCKKVFRSYQALGGHRASHKKIKLCSTDAAFASTSAARIQEGESESRSAAAAAAGGRADDHRKIHECPVCFRVFASGQALGGHKRSHVSASASASGSATAAAAAKFGDSLIDLNLPAPVEDDDVSQVELSAVSDAEFVDPVN